MTREQIAELRAAIQALDAKTLPVRPVPVRMVEKLLDEREALLEFLKSLDQVLEFEVREIWAEAQRCIANAEAG